MNRSDSTRLQSAMLLVSVVWMATVRPIAAFDCPSTYTLTSVGCSSWCTNALIPSDGCIFYPTTGAVTCTDTSVGYCASTTSASCSVKCLATSFLVDDTVSLDDGTLGKTLSLGLRGSSGSFGRSEPIETIQNLALAHVTKL